MDTDLTTLQLRGPALLIRVERGAVSVIQVPRGMETLAMMFARVLNGETTCQRT
jgi:hypothetical protein